MLCLILWVPQITKTVSNVCYTSYCECLRSTRLSLCVLYLILWVPQINKTVSVCVLRLILWVTQINKTVSMSSISHTVSASDHQDCFYVCYASNCECLRSPRLFLCVLCLILWTPQINKTVSNVCYASYFECLRSPRLSMCAMPHTVSALDQKDCFYVCYTSYCECCRSPRLFLCVLCIKLCVLQINKTVSVCAMPHTGSASDQQDWFYVCYAS